MQQAASGVAVSAVFGLLCTEPDSVLPAVAGAWKRTACAGNFKRGRGLSEELLWKSGVLLKHLH